MSKRAFDWEPECAFGTILSFYARKVPEHPAKIRIYKWLARIKPDPVFVYQKKARFRALTSDYIGDSVVRQGVWESKSLAFAVGVMRRFPNETFLDVGANHGNFSVAVGRITGCPCVAIEPLPQNYENLMRNIKLNPGIRIRTFPCAATATATRISLSAEKNGAEAWTKISSSENDEGKKCITGRPLHRILQEAQVSKTRLMKIDVEGFELEVFHGIDWNSSPAPKAVLMECQPSDKEKVSFLLERGFRAHTVDGSMIDGLKEYPEGNLIFTRTKK
jgi:FkbM family methyltransferase